MVITIVDNLQANQCGGLAVHQCRHSLLAILITAIAGLMCQCGGDDGSDGNSLGDAGGDVDTDGDGDSSFTIDVILEGEGEVSFDPDQDSYEKGDEVSIEAQADEGWRFDHWSGDLDGEDEKKDVTVLSNLSITAHFVKTYQLKIEVEGEGEVTWDPEGELFDPETQIELIADAAFGFEFDGWKGDINGSANPYSLTMDNDKAVTAVFSELDKTLYTTCVQDTLDNEDRVIFVEKMTALGYEEIGNNTDVTRDELKALIEDEETFCLYHTGRGMEGGVATSTSLLVIQDLEVVNVGNLIVSAGLTMVPTMWMNKMSGSTQNVLGYTDDFVFGFDSDVARLFGNALSQGDSYILAWYRANDSQSSADDRWLGYVRESAGVVEYSARSGNVPSKTLLSNLHFVGERVWVTEHLLSDARTFASAFEQLTFNDYRVVSPGQVQHRYFRRNDEPFLAQTTISREKAVKLANAWLSQTLPEDAILAEATPIDGSINGAARVTIAYSVRYIRQLDDLPLLTNGLAYYYGVLVNDNVVAASAQHWPVIKIQPTWRPDLTSSLLSVKRAISFAIDAIDNLSKQPATLVDVTAAYGVKQGHLVPAYALIEASGTPFIVDASTGELLD